MHSICDFGSVVRDETSRLGSRELSAFTIFRFAFGNWRSTKYFLELHSVSFMRSNKIQTIP